MNHEKLKAKYDSILKLLDKIDAVRKAQKQAHAEAMAWLGKYSQYGDDFKDLATKTRREIAHLEAQMRGSSAEWYAQLLTELKELASLAEQVSAEPVDLADPRLTNAIRLAEAGALDYAEATRLAAQFAPDQAALRILKRVFENAGVNSAIDALLYEGGILDSEKAREFAYHIAWDQHSRPATMVSFLAKRLAPLGIGDVPDFDPESAALAARQAAGLPEVTQ